MRWVRLGQDKGWGSCWLETMSAREGRHQLGLRNWYKDSFFRMRAEKTQCLSLLGALYYRVSPPLSRRCQTQLKWQHYCPQKHRCGCQYYRLLRTLSWWHWTPCAQRLECRCEPVCRCELAAAVWCEDGLVPAAVAAAVAMAVASATAMCCAAVVRAVRGAEQQT